MCDEWEDSVAEINIVHNWKDCDGIGYSKDNIQKIALWIDKEMQLENGTGIVLVIFVVMVKYHNQKQISESAYTDILFQRECP